MGEQALSRKRKFEALMDAVPITKAELARAVGVKPQAVQGWMNTGKMARENVATGAAALRCTEAQLLSILDEEQRNGRSLFSLEEMASEARDEVAAYSQTPALNTKVARLFDSIRDGVDNGDLEDDDVEAISALVTRLRRRKH